MKKEYIHATIDIQFYNDMDVLTGSKEIDFNDLIFDEGSQF